MYNNITKLVKTPIDLIIKLLVVNYHLAVWFGHEESGKIPMICVQKYNQLSKINFSFAHGFDLELI